MTNIKLPQADPTLALVKETTSENSDPPSIPLRLNVPDADVILRSSDQVNFRVHKSLLAMSSLFFEDLFSLPQPPDGEKVDGLPLVQLSEDAGLLTSLISLLYPTPPIIPGSYEKVFALLAACQKYDMLSIQSTIRAEMKRGTFPTPIGTEAFRGYAIACIQGLVPELEAAARLTLGYPMTFESLGEELQSFSGQALCDLVRYRKRCRDNLVTCFDTFFDVRSRCQIWVGCRNGIPRVNPQTNVPTIWLYDFFTSKSVELKRSFVHAISSPSNILEEYLTVLKTHTQSGCFACASVHLEGQTLYRELENELAQELNEVNNPI